MKSSRARLKGRFLSLLGGPLISMCAQCASIAGASSPTPAATPKSFEELKRDEYRHPKDPQIKLEMARRYWCAHQRGLAMEHWIWVQQSAPGISEAAAYLKAAKEQPKTLAERLRCEALKTP